jgi:O-antigen ligase
MHVNSQINLSPKLIKILSLVSASIIPLLLTGPFIPDLIISLLSIFFLIISFRYKIYDLYLNKFFIIFLIFWLICIISSLLSEHVLFSLKSSIFYIRIAIFALLISFLINQNKKILIYFYYFFMVTFSIIVIDGFVQYFIGFNLIGYKLYEIGNSAFRLSSFFGEELILGSYLSRLFPLFFVLFVIKQEKNYYEFAYAWVLFIFINVLIFLSGERASFLFLNISTIFILILIRSYKFFFISIFFLSILLNTTILFQDKRLYSRYIVSPINSIGINNMGNKNFFFSPEHDSLFRTAWKMFLDKPFLGHGPKTYRLHCDNKKYSTGVSPCHTHPHNFYIQLLAETGLIGASFLIGLFFYIIFLALRHAFVFIKYKKFYLSDYQICLLAGLLVTTWPLTTNGNFFTNYLMMFYSLQIGFFRKDL